MSDDENNFGYGGEEEDIGPLPFENDIQIDEAFLMEFSFSFCNLEFC